MRRTKIVGTIGPASRAPETLERLLVAGLGVARLNFSHGRHEEHGAAIRDLRAAARKLNRPLAILQDLAGPKIRIGEIPGGPVTLRAGAEFVLTSRPVAGSEREVSLTYAGLPADVAPGDSLLLGDGALELEVRHTDGRDIVCRVMVGGTISSHKGINAPTARIRAPILGEKDKADLLFGIAQGVDWVALSFVRDVTDIETVRAFLRDHDAALPLIAKIEKHEALDQADAIVQAVDGIMVARGDLSVEIPMHRVPRFQKELIARANRAGKPVITATQMLLSMVDNPRPTRAEVADVANAVLDGTDAVMLSEETAAGRYPVETVAMMARIAEDAEQIFPHAGWEAQRLGGAAAMSRGDAVADAACELARDLGAAAILCCTATGATAQAVSRYRPACPILAPTSDPVAYRRLALVWGVEPMLIPSGDRVETVLDTALAEARQRGLLQPGQQVVLTAGVPLGGRGSTNLIKVETV